VIDSPDDLKAVGEYVAEFPEISCERVLVMPQGTDQEQLEGRAEWLKPFCAAEGFVYCPRSKLNGTGRCAGRDMNAWRYTFASLRHYRRIHIAVMLGVAVATAVLTGALLVGDSVRGSLRDLTVERLGKIDTVLVAQHPFRAALAGELAADAEFKKYFETADPAFLLNGSLQAGSGKDARRRPISRCSASPRASGRWAMAGRPWV